MPGKDLAHGIYQLALIDLGLRLGASSYVTKPFSTKVLVQEIEKALG